MKLFYTGLLLLLSLFSYSQDTTECLQLELPNSREVNIFRDNPTIPFEELECFRFKLAIHVINTGDNSTDISDNQIYSAIESLNLSMANEGHQYVAEGVELPYSFVVDTITRKNGNTLFGSNYGTYGISSNSGTNGVYSTVIRNYYEAIGFDGDVYWNVFIYNKYYAASIVGFAWLNNVPLGTWVRFDKFGDQELVENGEYFAGNPNNKTLVHEIGHVLSLRHIFDNTTSCESVTYGDGVDDTPVQTQTFSCTSLVCGTNPLNHMGYRSCRDKFTQGQADRIWGVVNHPAFDFSNYIECESAPCTTSPDINNDGIVNLYDLSTINASFGSVIGDANYNELADLNCDGAINLYDISLISASFGSQALILSINDLPAEITLYDLLGRVVKQPKASGVYIMRQNGMNQKVFIKN